MKDGCRIQVINLTLFNLLLSEPLNFLQLNSHFCLIYVFTISASCWDLLHPCSLSQSTPISLTCSACFLFSDSAFSQNSTSVIGCPVHWGAGVGAAWRTYVTCDFHSVSYINCHSCALVERGKGNCLSLHRSCHCYRRPWFSHRH